MLPLASSWSADLDRALHLGMSRSLAPSPVLLRSLDSSIELLQPGWPTTSSQFLPESDTSSAPKAPTMARFATGASPCRPQTHS